MSRKYPIFGSHFGPPGQIPGQNLFKCSKEYPLNMNCRSWASPPNNLTPNRGTEGICVYCFRWWNSGRSRPSLVATIIHDFCEMLHDGVLGRIHLGKCVSSSSRGQVDTGKMLPSDIAFDSISVRIDLVLPHSFFYRSIKTYRTWSDMIWCTMSWFNLIGSYIYDNMPCDLTYMIAPYLI